MPRFSIRDATPGDIPLLVRHRNAMFEEYKPMTEEALKGADKTYGLWAKRMMRLGLFHGYVVETSTGEVAASGCVWLRQVQPSRGRPASLVPYVMSIYTEAAHRRRGLASRIVKEAMRWGRKNGFRRMTLHASTKGKRVYSRLGWERTWEMEVRLDRRTAQSRRPSRSAHSPGPARNKRAPKSAEGGRRSRRDGSRSKHVG